MNDAAGSGPFAARRAELMDAFRLLFRNDGPDRAEERARGALHLIEQGDFRTDGILVMRGRKGLIAALVCLPIAGASALVWPPQTLPGLPEGRASEDVLVQQALSWLRGQDVKLCQALLSAHEVVSAGPLLRNGFRHTTALWYMRHWLEPTIPSLRALSYETFDQCDVDLFSHTLLRTYEDTQDCPELGGVRDVGEILAGHRAQGRFDPRRWWLAWLDGTPAGVLLLAEAPEEGGFDLSYLGIVPAMRRRGLGRALTEKAIVESRRRGGTQLTLAVDERNAPALALYRSLGFEPYDRREVFLCFLREKTR